MTDIVDPATLRPGDMARAEWDRYECHYVAEGAVTLKSDGWIQLGEITEFSNFADTTVTWYLVSRAEPERGSVWRHPVIGIFYYEPDARWPHTPWVDCSTGSRLGLTDTMTFVRSAVSSHDH